MPNLNFNPDQSAYEQLLNEYRPANLQAIPSQALAPAKTPRELAEEEYMRKLATQNIVKSNPIADLITSVPEAYKSSGGGWKGTGVAALTGIGKIGELMSSKMGQQIMAGQESDPYKAGAYVNQANIVGQQEYNMAQLVAQKEQQRMGSIGELIKQKESEKHDIQKLKMQQEGEIPLRLSAQKIQEFMAELAAKKEVRESESDIARRLQEEEKQAEEQYKTDLSSRGFFGKTFLPIPKRQVVQETKTRIPYRILHQ